MRWKHAVLIEITENPFRQRPCPRPLDLGVGPLIITQLEYQRPVGKRNVGREIAPLLDELQKIVSAEKPNPDGEKALLTILGQIAPKLTGYDPAAARPERLKIIQAWLKTSG